MPNVFVPISEACGILWPTSRLPVSDGPGISYMPGDGAASSSEGGAIQGYDPLVFGE